MKDEMRLALARARLEQAKDRLAEALGDATLKFPVVCDLRDFFRPYGLSLDYARPDNDEEYRAYRAARGWYVERKS